jgi:cytochrome c oxidase subunit IV
MSEFHDDYPQYELMAHHSEEAGKVMRRKLWNVFWIMLGITILELIIGSYAKDLHLIDELDRSSTSILKIIFIGLTLGKAYYIIYKFMHLEHEKKGVKYAVIAPYTVFILYFVFVLVSEANYSKEHKTKMDHLIEQQKIDLNAAAASGHGHEVGTHEAGAAHEGTEHHEAATEEHH